MADIRILNGKNIKDATAEMLISCTYITFVKN